MQCAEKLLETMKLPSCWTRHFRFWKTKKYVWLNQLKFSFMRGCCWTLCHVSWSSPVQGWHRVLSVELPPASAAAGFSPSSHAAAVVTKSCATTTSTTSLYVFNKCTEPAASRCVTSYSEINLFRSLNLFLSSACKRINRCDAWLAAAPVRQRVFGIEWEISHSLRPADLWPCCTSVAPASAAAQRPPARPGAVAEHPKERWAILSIFAQ